VESSNLKISVWVWKFNLWNFWWNLIWIECVFNSLTIWVWATCSSTNYGFLSSSISKVIDFKKGLFFFFIIMSLSGVSNWNFSFYFIDSNIFFFYNFIFLFNLFSLICKFFFGIIISIFRNFWDSNNFFWFFQSNFADSSVKDFNDISAKNQFFLHIKHEAKTEISNVCLISS